MFRDVTGQLFQIYTLQALEVIKSLLHMFEKCEECRKRVFGTRDEIS
jgi:hypothetical protein